MKLITALLLAIPLAAQLEVFTLQGTTPVPLGPSINLGAAAAGDSTEFRIRAVNNGNAPVFLQTITVGGAGFSLASAFVPLTLTPGQSHNFSVRFSPPPKAPIAPASPSIPFPLSSAPPPSWGHPSS